MFKTKVTKKKVDEILQSMEDIELEIGILLDNIINARTYLSKPLNEIDPKEFDKNYYIGKGLEHIKLV